MKNLDMHVDSFKMKYEYFIIGCDSLEDEGIWDTDTYGSMGAFYTNDMVSIILRLIASDKTISQDEVDYMNNTFSFEYTLDELIYVYKSVSDNIGNSFEKNLKEGFARLQGINNKIADAYKELIHLICDIIIESDGIISVSEIDEVNLLKSKFE